ncbi:MAG: sprT domain-containing protein, partial [Sphingobacteriaceae bacterium]|nr:sprT domain-containing protein [Cytophagaceae bacterium]
LTEAVFTPAVLEPLRVYAQNPAASTAGFPPLTQALQALDSPLTETLTLHHLREGDIFRFHQRTFVRGPLRRTRVLCIEQATGRRYTVPAHASIEQAEGHE